MTYDFKSWSDHGAQTHTITTPTANQTITATTGREGTAVGGPGMRMQRSPVLRTTSFIDDDETHR